jgi:hypothetical protein
LPQLLGCRVSSTRQALDTAERRKEELAAKLDSAQGELLLGSSQQFDPDEVPSEQPGGHPAASLLASTSARGSVVLGGRAVRLNATVDSSKGRIRVEWSMEASIPLSGLPVHRIGEEAAPGGAWAPSADDFIALYRVGDELLSGGALLKHLCSESVDVARDHWKLEWAVGSAIELGMPDKFRQGGAWAIAYVTARHAIAGTVPISMHYAGVSGMAAPPGELGALPWVVQWLPRLSAGYLIVPLPPGEYPPTWRPVIHVEDESHVYVAAMLPPSWALSQARVQLRFPIDPASLSIEASASRFVRIRLRLKYPGSIRPPPVVDVSLDELGCLPKGPVRCGFCSHDVVPAGAVSRAAAVPRDSWGALDGGTMFLCHPSHTLQQMPEEDALARDAKAKAGVIIASVASLAVHPTDTARRSLVLGKYYGPQTVEALCARCRFPLGALRSPVDGLTGAFVTDTSSLLTSMSEHTTGTLRDHGALLLSRASVRYLHVDGALRSDAPSRTLSHLLAHKAATKGATRWIIAHSTRPAHLELLVLSWTSTCELAVPPSAALRDTLTAPFHGPIDEKSRYTGLVVRFSKVEGGDRAAWDASTVLPVRASHFQELRQALLHGERFALMVGFTETSGVAWLPLD